MKPRPILLTIIDTLAILLLGMATYYALIKAPTELVMGSVQRVFYFHIGTAWTALIGFLFTAVLSVIYLITKDLKWDRFQVAAIEVSLVFFFITIVLGSIWARPAWNTWWTWDPRLTTYTIMALIYIAYLMLRQGIEDPTRRARFAAAYGIAVTLTMAITTLIFYRVLVDGWGWAKARALGLCVPLLLIEAGFLGANVVKIPHGGWFALTVGLGLMVQMATWRKGRALVAERIRRGERSLSTVLAEHAGGQRHEAEPGGVDPGDFLHDDHRIQPVRTRAAPLLGHELLLDELLADPRRVGVLAVHLRDGHDDARAVRPGGDEGQRGPHRRIPAGIPVHDPLRARWRGGPVAAGPRGGHRRAVRLHAGRGGRRAGRPGAHRAGPGPPPTGQWTSVADRDVRQVQRDRRQRHAEAGADPGHRAGLAPGTAFGPGAPDFLRLCFACSLDTLGEGLRRLVRETCDYALRIPISGPISSLNASVSAALALAE